MGRQLDAEADRRDAARAAREANEAKAAQASPTLPSSISNLRRGRLLGRSDPNAELVLYAEAWARRIQLNMSPANLREAAKQPHTDALVTVALRSDGSVESIAFVRSSGVPLLDEAIRDTIQGLAPYSAFPPNLARVYDVVEIRRTWYIDSAIRLY